MAKVIAICGKICCGKSYYANILKEKENAVILSCDEVTKYLFNNNMGEKHDEMLKNIQTYLLKKSTDIVKTNTNVILDWGFWSNLERENIKKYFLDNDILCEWHYVKVDDETWQKNILERNEKVLKGDSKLDYYLDEGLLNKLQSKWEEPTNLEINIVYEVKR